MPSKVKVNQRYPSQSNKRLKTDPGQLTLDKYFGANFEIVDLKERASFKEFQIPEDKLLRKRIKSSFINIQIEKKKFEK